MKQRKSFTQHIADNNSQSKISESLVGKGFAIGQNRQHAANKTKLLSTLTQIQNDCRQGVREDDKNKKIDLIFQIAFEFAGALKVFAEMSSNTNNISTTSVLDTESVKKEIERISPRTPK